VDIYSAAITLIIVMDPLGNIPIFLAILNNVEPNRRSWVILREALFAYLILVLFLFAGKHILSGLHVTESALGIGGGIILFLIAIKMIFPPNEEQRDKVMGEPFIVPLAVPLTAGPSAIATVLLLATQEPTMLFSWLASLTIAIVICTAILLCAGKLRTLLGQKGLVAIERLMGMILTTVSVQMFLDGINHYFKFGLG
jgi:multiple antibiotic resistance protein